MITAHGDGVRIYLERDWLSFGASHIPSYAYTNALSLQNSGQEDKVVRIPNTYASVAPMQSANLDMITKNWHTLNVPAFVVMLTLLFPG